MVSWNLKGTAKRCSFLCDSSMAKEWAKGFYDSTAWKRCRDNYIATRIMVDGGMCEECHERLGYIVHHKINLTSENINDHDISLNPSNLAYVCKPCHDREEGHFIGKTQGLLCSFDANGQPISNREVDIKGRPYALPDRSQTLP